MHCFCLSLLSGKTIDMGVFKGYTNGITYAVLQCELIILLRYKIINDYIMHDFL